TGATAVTFAGFPGTDVVVLSDSALLVTTPARAAGVVTVRVKTRRGTSAASTAARYSFVDRPTVTGVLPASGPAGGARSVTISGSKFRPDVAVRFGDIPATSVQYVSPAQLKVIAPAGSATVDITVTTAGGTSAIVDAGRFTYF